MCALLVFIHGLGNLISMLGPKLTICCSECQHIHNNQLAREQHTWLSQDLLYFRTSAGLFIPLLPMGFHSVKCVWDRGGERD